MIVETNTNNSSELKILSDVNVNPEMYKVGSSLGQILNLLTIRRRQQAHYIKNKKDVPTLRSIVKNSDKIRKLQKYIEKKRNANEIALCNQLLGTVKKNKKLLRKNSSEKNLYSTK